MDSSDEPKPSRASSADHAAKRALAHDLESNRRAREATQAVLLLNGGMATATIIFNGSRGGLGPNAMFALEAFGTGLVFGVCTLFFQVACLAAWTKHRDEIYAWKRDIGRPEAFETVKVSSSRRRALFWRNTIRLSLALSVLVFFIGGVALCIGLSRLPLEDPDRRRVPVREIPAHSESQALSQIS